MGFMPKRTDWLTEFARPVAEDLAARCGSLKKIMSAGVMALNDLSAEEREYYMAKADGVDLETKNPNTPREALRRITEKNIDDSAEVVRGKKLKRSKTV
jgi:hypothetical protein